MCGSACCPFEHIAPRLAKPPPPGPTSQTSKEEEEWQESNAQESSKKVATPACSVHRDDGRRREEEQVDRNVRPREGEQHGNAQAPPPHRQGNPFGTIHDSDMTENPNANTLNTYFQEAMARRPSERVNDDWPKHSHSISVCSVGLDHLRHRSPEFDVWIRKVDRNNVPDHKKTQAFRPNCRLRRHYLRDILPRVFPVLRVFTRTYFIDCRNLQEPPRHG